VDLIVQRRRATAMRVFVESRLSCDADLVWSTVQTTALLLEVCAPLVDIHPLPGEAFPERWPAGETIRCRSYLFGVLPLGTRTIYFERIDPEAREIQSRESDFLVQRWDHLVRVRPDAEGGCWYSDEVEVEAGWRTPLVWLFASCLYRYRQRRWRRVVRRLVG
jgi:hypothetical protein